MSKYQPGDKVRIINNSDYRGLVQTVSDVCSDREEGLVVRTEDDRYAWHVSSVERVLPCSEKDEPPKEFEPGDRVCAPKLMPGKVLTINHRSTVIDGWVMTNGLVIQEDHLTHAEDEAPELTVVAVDAPQDEAPVSDPVNLPRHYRDALPSGHDVWDLIVHLGIGEQAALANVLKYVLRFEKKNGTEDLKKAGFYLSKLIEMREARETEGTA